MSRRVLTPEQVERRRVYERERWARMTDEQRAKKKAKSKRYEQSEKGKEARRVKNKAYAQTEAGMTAHLKSKARYRKKIRRENVAILRLQHLNYKAPVSIQSRVREDQLYAMCARIVPRSVDREIREDLISDLCLAVLDGRADKATLPDFFKRAKRAYDYRFDELSFDAPAPGRDKMTLHDLIAAPGGEL